MNIINSNEIVQALCEIGQKIEGHREKLGALVKKNVQLQKKNQDQIKKLDRFLDERSVK